MANFVWINGKRDHSETFAWKIEILLWNYLTKIEIFRKFVLQNRNFLSNCLVEIEIFRKFAWKNQNFFDSDFDPQISNQIDAAAVPEFHAKAPQQNCKFKTCPRSLRGG